MGLISEKLSRNSFLCWSPLPSFDWDNLGQSCTAIRIAHSLPAIARQPAKRRLIAAFSVEGQILAFKCTLLNGKAAKSCRKVVAPGFRAEHPERQALQFTEHRFDSSQRYWQGSEIHRRSCIRRLNLRIVMAIIKLLAEF